MESKGLAGLSANRYERHNEKTAQACTSQPPRKGLTVRVLGAGKLGRDCGVRHRDFASDSFFAEDEEGAAIGAISNCAKCCMRTVVVALFSVAAGAGALACALGREAEAPPPQTHPIAQQKPMAVADDASATGRRLTHPAARLLQVRAAVSRPGEHGAVWPPVADAAVGRNDESRRQPGPRRLSNDAGAARPLPGSRPASHIRLIQATQPAGSTLQSDQPPMPPEAIPLGAPDRRVGISLDELQPIALANNPTLAQAAAHVSAVRGAWVQSGLYPNPRVGYEGMEMGNEGKSGLQGGFVEQEIVTHDKLRLGRAVASREIGRLQREYDAQRWRVLNDVRIEFYNALVAQHVKELADGMLADARQRVDIARRARANQEIEEFGEFEEAQIQIDLHAVEIMHERANQRFDAAWRRLAAVAGAPGMPSTFLAGNIEAAIPHCTWDESLARLLSASPQVSAARADVERARFALAKAQAERHSNFNVRAGRSTTMQPEIR